MLIVISGPDGTGKTTLAKLLSDRIPDLNYIYFGSNVENRQYKYFDRFIKKEKSGKLRTAFKYFVTFLNDFYYFRKAQHQHIIADRCPIDKYVGTKIHNKKYRFLYHKLALRLLPDPDHIILLEGDLETIYQRKKEIPVSVIELMIKYYKEYIFDHNISFSTLDTTKYSLDESYTQAEKIVKELL
tara:strand:+ start:42217 stop:42771 length:555 start_codon:yes stop_codon:yes gene_type:complete